VTIPVSVRRWGVRHLDELLALVVLLWGGISTAVRHTHAGGPLALNLVLVAVMAAVCLVRRRLPLVFMAVTLGCTLIGVIWLEDLTRSTWSIYVLLLPAYTVAAFCELRQAAVGLGLALGAGATIAAFQTHVFTDLLFASICAVTAWTIGRAMRHRRALARELRHRAQWLQDERDDRARLAVADERSRIARELHAVVANSVSAMVVQAQAAQRLLNDDPVTADAAMTQIELTGRDALAEMRRILGVLRRDDESAQLAPQPGVGQLHALVERARERGRPVVLHAEGEPSPLPVSVDLAVYRIVEDALDASRGGADVVLRFLGEEVELEITCAGARTERWPTVAMSERVALCEGTVDGAPEGGRLVVRLPQSFAEAFA
jgi:signal transduction histidine kinase